MKKTVVVTNGLMNNKTFAHNLNKIVKEVEASKQSKGILAKFKVMFEKTKNTIILL